MSMRDALIRIIRTLSWAVLVVALLGVTLATDPLAADGLAPKAFYFALAASLLPALAVLKLWQGAPLKLPRGSLALGLLLLLLVQTLAYAFSPLRAHAQGAWQAWLLVLLLFFGAFDLLDDEAAWLRCLRWLSAAALLAGLWSLAQSMGLDSTVMGKACREAFGPRIAACLGNPNFAGGFFVILLPILTWSAWRDPMRKTRFLARGALALALAGLWLSASKAAMLGLGVELALGAHLLFWSSVSAQRKQQALKALGLGLAAALLLGLFVLPPVSRQRLLFGWAPGAESVQFRRLTWAGSLKAFAERPVLGWGPGNFDVVYPSHRVSNATAGLVQRSYEVSHAENWIVQTLVESGTLGLVSLLFLLLCLLWPLRLAAKVWDQGPVEGSLALALLCALLGSLACNLASLDLYLPSTLLPFILLSALAAQVGALPLFALRLNPEPYARILVSLGLAVFASVPPLQAQMQWSASRDLEDAKALSGAGRFGEAIPLYQRALMLHAGNLEARYFLASSYQDRAQGDDLVKAGQEYEQLRRLAPDYVLIHAKLARLKTAQGQGREAAAEWERQLELDPYLLEAVRELSTLYASQGQLPQAAKVLREGSQRFPDDLNLRQNLAAVEAAMAKRGGR